MGAGSITIRNPAIDHITALDGLRGIAILPTLSVHAYYRGPGVSSDFSRAVNQFLIFGGTGVELFFVLSGFLISSIVANSLRDQSGLKPFYIRRFGRIVPAYALLVLAVAALSFVPLGAKIDPITSAARHHLGIYLTFTENLADLFGIDISEAAKALGPLWSVALEQHYYLIWPPILYYCGVRRGMWIASCWVLLCLTSRIALYDRLGASDMFHHSTIFHMDGLLIGSLTALVARTVQIARNWLYAYVAATAICLGVLWGVTGDIHYSEYNVQTFGFTIINLFYSSLVLLASSGLPASKLFETRWLIICGKYSYSMYLFHWPLLLLMSHLDVGVGGLVSGVYFLAVVAITLIVAKVVWGTIEGPANRFFRNLAKGSREGIAANDQRELAPHELDAAGPDAIIPDGNATESRTQLV